MHAVRPWIIGQDSNNEWINDDVTSIRDLPTHKEAYEWKNVKEKDFETAIRNAESYGRHAHLRPNVFY